MKMSNRRTLSLLTAVAMVVSLGLSGCGSSAPSVSSAPAPAPASSPAADNASQPAPAEAAPQVLRVAKYFDSISMDPAQWTANNAYTSNCFESLCKYDDNLTPSPSLAESWETSEDGLTWTFHLRKGVQFHHDYGEFTADDVIYTFERMRDPAVGASVAGPSVNVDNMDSITAVDPYTVAFKLKKPDINFLDKHCEFFGYIVSKKACEEKGLDGFKQMPVGTGAFMFESLEQGTRYELARFEEYWGEKTKLDHVTVHVITEAATAKSAFESGEIDLMPLSDTATILEFQQNPEYVVDVVPSRSQLTISLNTHMKPFDDIRVRQAVAYAMDYDGLLEGYFANLEVPTTSVIAPFIKYCETGLLERKYDPEKAKALLAEAGYPDGFDTQFSCPNDAISIGPATVIQTYLTAVGIRAPLNALDFGVYAEQKRAGQLAMSMIYSDAALVPDDWFINMSSPTNKMWDDPTYVGYVQEALAANTEEAKAAAFKKAQERIVSEVPIVPVTNSTGIRVFKTFVKNVTSTKNSRVNIDKIYIEK